MGYTLAHATKHIHPIDDVACPVARRRLRKLLEITRLMEAGCTRQAALKNQGVSQSTYYEWKALLEAKGMRGLVPKSKRPKTHPGRRWTMDDASRICRLRQERPWEGKRRIQAAHNRLYPERPLALAAVGRILSWLRGRRRIRPCDWWRRGGKTRQPRDFTQTHAQPFNPKEDWHRGVQMDSMTIWEDGRCFKEFRAVMPDNREMFSKVYSRATADTARDFLLEAVKRLDIRCIQVDGGSEFRGVFEETCAELGIELLVLRPQNPKWNGLVERANRTVREEFWAHYTGDYNCQGINEALDRYRHYYNHLRPHYALGLKTPAEYATMTAVSARV